VETHHLASASLQTEPGTETPLWLVSVFSQARGLQFAYTKCHDHADGRPESDARTLAAMFRSASRWGTKRSGVSPRQRQIRKFRTAWALRAERSRPPTTPAAKQARDAETAAHRDYDKAHARWVDAVAKQRAAEPKIQTGPLLFTGDLTPIPPDRNSGEQRGLRDAEIGAAHGTARAAPAPRPYWIKRLRLSRFWPLQQ
jgi:hypothetical protein